MVPARGGGWYDGVASLPVRLGRMSDTIARMERVALVLIPKLLAYRDDMFPDASSWRADSRRHPQPDPVLLLAVREWVWSMADTRRGVRRRAPFRAVCAG